jgi:hypothetical protein
VNPTVPVALAPQDLHLVVTRPVMWLFIAILVTFVITRTITRTIRARGEKGEKSAGPVRDIVIGGVHIHHTVIGIFLMLGAGIALIAVTPVGDALNATAIVFGVGVSLTFDEFALWLHLSDVYWLQQGRQSIDAIFVVLAVTGALIGGADFLSGVPGTASWWISVAILLLTLVCSVVCLLKGKLMAGVLGVFVPVVALIGAFRLAKPDSWWARKRYLRRRAHRQVRCEKRFGPRYTARWNRLKDMVGGAPDPVAAAARPVPSPGASPSPPPAPKDHAPTG